MIKNLIHTVCLCRFLFYYLRDLGDDHPEPDQSFYRKAQLRLGLIKSQVSEIENSIC